MSEFRMFQGTLCGRHGGSYWFLRERLKFLKGIPGGPSPKAQALSFEPSTLESKSSTRPPPMLGFRKFGLTFLLELPENSHVNRSIERPSAPTVDPDGRMKPADLMSRICLICLHDLDWPR